MPSRAHPDALLAIARALNRTGTRWYVFGAQAVAVWGEPRSTNDIDVTVRFDRDPHRLVSELSAEGFRLRVADFDDFVARTRVLPFAHESGLALDVVLAGSGLEEQFLTRTRPIEVAGETIPFIDPSDLVVSKVLAGRPKDREDVRLILAARRAELDIPRIRALLEELEEALAQSDLVPAFEALLAEHAARKK